MTSPIKPGCLALVIPSPCPQVDDPGWPGDSAVTVINEVRPQLGWCHRRKWWEVNVQDWAICECALLRIDGYKKEEDAAAVREAVK